MSRKVKVVKVNPEPARGKFGVNPSDPWSVQANISEGGGSLDTYLLSRGINPKFVSKNTKISHSKSTQFQKWKNNHKFEEVEHELEQLEEDAMLDKYLSSRGINPKFATKMVKISYAKSHEFEKWKRDHMFESMEKQTPTEMRLHALKKAQHRNTEIRSDGMHKKLHSEEADKKDTITMDIPFLIRVLELAREDVKTDVELHKVVEKLIDIRGRGTLTMDDYEFVAKLKEEYCEIIEAKTIQGTALDKFRQSAAERAKKHDEIQKQQSKNSSGMSSAIDRLQKHLNKEEVVNEMDQKFIDSLNKLAHRHKEGDRVTVNSKFFGKQKGKVVKVDSQSVHVQRDGKSVPEKYPHNAVMKENTLDPLAATEAPCDGANGADDSSEKKRQLSKSARMIKALYKKHNMKEEMYDWEKDDKNQTSPGKKKPKLDTTSDESNFGSNKPQARAVMSGGKTMTGEKRDVVEIDPLLKNRPDLNGNTKDVTDKKNNKINN